MEFFALENNHFTQKLKPMDCELTLYIKKSQLLRHAWRGLCWNDDFFGKAKQIGLNKYDGKLSITRF